MEQFDAMTVHDCNSSVKAWIDVNDKYNLNFYIIYQIGSAVLSDSLKMARYTNVTGASAIVSVPPFHEIPDETGCNMISCLFNSMTDSSNNMDFWVIIYLALLDHNMDTYKFVNTAIIINDGSTSGMPGLTGIEYAQVIIKDGLNQYVILVIKLQCFGLGMGNGTVLADFYARTFRCMKYYYENQMYDEMYNQQMRQINIPIMFIQYGGVAERYVYQQLANVSIGPPRRLQASITQAV